ncbi:Ig-like domain-containing protein [Hymenobacter sp. BT683]|uniref:Ig-like domain-containing protein n=1 Tax=Hymenobacter jeongseonensis TaxID=2791027 RepID=A0ABS0INA9_9BACT|nr:Ig-like domain-containing protein [Hymenobacter jeongseonensis]MBF9239270.1 Ig-like domain-containing protein [Hymenobacter jeongseonensis]
MLRRFLPRVAYALICSMLLLSGCQKTEEPPQSPTPPTPPTSPTGGLTVFDNVRVIDSTLFRLDTASTQLAAGNYRFTASGAPLNMPVGAVIVGAQGYGFLRKVTGSSTAGNVTTLTTEPASLAQVFSSGTLDLPIDFGVLQGRSTIKQGRGTADAAGIHYSASNIPVIQRSGLSVTIRSVKADLEPHMRFKAEFGLLGLTSAEVATRGGIFDANMVLNTNVGGALAFPNEPIRLKRFTHVIRTAVPSVPFPVPVVMFVVVTLNLETSMALNAGLNYDGTLASHANFDLGMAYANGKWQGINNVVTENSYLPGPVTVNATGDASVALVPRLDVRFYNMVGPYIALDLKAGFKVTSGAPNWDYESTAGIDAKAGLAAGSFLGPQVDNFNATWPWVRFVQKAPERLELTSGNNQTGPSATALPQPVRTRVLNSRGGPVQFVRVSFTPAPNHGSVSPASVTTDANGYAQTSWTLGTAGGVQSLSVTAKKGDGQDISNAPLAVTATMGGCLTPAQSALLTGGGTKVWHLVTFQSTSTGAPVQAIGPPIRYSFNSNNTLMQDLWQTMIKDVPPAPIEYLNIQRATPLTVYGPDPFCRPNIGFSIGYGSGQIVALTATQLVVRAENSAGYSIFTFRPE